MMVKTQYHLAPTRTPPVDMNEQQIHQNDHRQGNPPPLLASACWAILLVGLFALSLHKFLLFHSLAELVSVSVAFAIFIIVWNSRQYIQNGYMLLLGISLLFVGVFDLIHALAYKGMSVFADRGTNLATQLWIVSRYMHSLSFLIAPLFLRRRLKVTWAFACYGIVSGLMLLIIFRSRVFPTCFDDTRGVLTPFKEISEFIIIGILLVSLGLLWKKRSAFDPRVWRYVACSIVLTVISEFMFTQYTNVYGWTNSLGHLVKVASFFFVYKALIEIGLREPYNLLYRELKQREVDLQQAHDELEERVRRRTAELSQAVESLRDEVEARMRAEQSYRASETKYRSLVERVPAITHVSALDGTRTTLYISPQVEPILGISPSEYTDNPQMWASRLHPDDRERVLAEMYRAREPNTQFFVEYRMLTRDNRVLWFRDKAAVVEDAGGGGLCVQGVMYDITKQKEMEQELAAQARTLEAFFKYSITPLLILDRHFNFISVNQAYADFCRRDVSEFKGHNYFEFYPNPDTRSIFEATVQTKLTHQLSAEPFQFEDHPERGVTYWDWTLVPIVDESEQVESLVISLRDVTEAKKAKAKILADQEQLRALTTQLLSVEDQERRVIATELHDSVGQILAFIKIEMGELRREELPKQVMQTISHIREQVNEAIRQTRTLTFEISPPELYTLGLESALEELTQRFGEERQIECTVEDTDDLKPLSDQMKTLLYRSVRELLVNATKHAKATRVYIKVETIDRDVQITVKDDGAGFDTSRLDDRSPHGTAGFGLFSIRERLTHMGGSMYIESSRGQGTTVTLRAPLNDAGSS